MPPPPSSLIVRDLARATTDEATWQRWLDRLPTSAVAPRSVLVVSPHPDDETLGVGATLADWAAAGTRIEIVAVTDGEGSHPDRPELAALRRAEQDRALLALGIDARPVRLGLPDTAVAAHHAQLVSALADLGRHVDLVLAPWEHDGHGDHDAVGRAALDAAASIGTAIASYPIWAWQWARPADLDALDLVRTSPSPAARAAKARAIAGFETQLLPFGGRSPIVSAEVRSHFGRPHEVFGVRTRA